jgi:chloramphenicol 3-O-phosphotransferase
VILLLNGAFGIGKTTVARLLVARLERAVLFDPEPIGVMLQRVTRVGDFQDLRLWRRLTVVGLRVTRLLYRNVIVPMAFSNLDYLREIRTAASRIDPLVHHFCLVAPVDEVHARLRNRGEDPGRAAWQYRRAAECCVVHGGAEFAMHIDAAARTPAEIADQLSIILSRVDGEGPP